MFVFDEGLCKDLLYTNMSERKMKISLNAPEAVRAARESRIRKIRNTLPQIRCYTQELHDLTILDHKVFLWQSL